MTYPSRYVFQHKRAMDKEQLVRYVDDRERETKQLDFKAEIAGNRTEEAKDIAALANHLGGDLIVGINEKDERADGWHPILDSNLKRTLQQINQCLTLVRAESFQLSVDKPSKIDNIGKVIVVSVPPSPELVGVQKENASSLSFPVRIETHTKYLSYEEVMKRSLNSTRSTYLRLKSILSYNPKPPVRFSNRIVYSRGPGADVLLPLTEGAHGRVEKLDEEVLIVSIKAEVQSFDLATIPLELLRAIWLDRNLGESGNVPLLCMALEGQLMWYGRYWIIQT